jgi:hypothetical protein
VRTPRLAALAALAAALTACGSAPAPSLVQLRKQGTSVCTRADRSFGRIATPGGEAAGAAFLRHGIAVLGPELRLLRTLTAPAEADDVYQSAISALASELTALKAAIHALARQQDPVIAFKSLEHRMHPLATQANRAWQALEMPACVQL